MAEFIAVNDSLEIYKKINKTKTEISGLSHIISKVGYGWIYDRE